eukprot:2075681-Amphidinium_carterae.1
MPLYARLVSCRVGAMPHEGVRALAETLSNRNTLHISERNAEPSFVCLSCCGTSSVWTFTCCFHTSTLQHLAQTRSGPRGRCHWGPIALSSVTQVTLQPRQIARAYLHLAPQRYPAGKDA